MLEMLLATPKLTLPHHCSQAPWDTGVWCWGLSAIPWTPRCTLGWPGSTPAAGFHGNGEAHPCQQTPAVPQSLVSSPPVTWCPPEYLQRCSAPDLGWLSDREAKYDPAVTLLHPPPSFAPAGYCLASHIPPIHPSIRRTSSPPPRPVAKQLGWSWRHPSLPTCSPWIRSNPIIPSPLRASVTAAVKWGSTSHLSPGAHDRAEPVCSWWGWVPSCRRHWGVYTGVSPESRWCFSCHSLEWISGFALGFQGGGGSRAGPLLCFPEQPHAWETLLAACPNVLQRRYF